MSANATPGDKLANGHDTEVADEPVTISDEGAYGTHKQTVILVDTEGQVEWIERTLYNEKAEQLSESEQDVRFTFQIQGWEK